MQDRELLKAIYPAYKFFSENRHQIRAMILATVSFSLVFELNRATKRFELYYLPLYVLFPYLYLFTYLLILIAKREIMREDDKKPLGVLYEM